MGRARAPGRRQDALPAGGVLVHGRQHPRQAARLHALHRRRLPQEVRRRRRRRLRGLRARQGTSRMYTLPDRFEFLSDAWLDEARRFLERAVRAAQGRAGAVLALRAVRPMRRRTCSCRTTSARGRRATTASTMTVARGFDAERRRDGRGRLPGRDRRRPVHRHAGARRDEGDAPRGRGHARQGRRAHEGPHREPGRRRDPRAAARPPRPAHGREPRPRSPRRAAGPHAARSARWRSRATR